MINTDNAIAQELSGESYPEIDTHVIECVLITLEIIYSNR